MNFSRTVWITFQRRGMTSSVSVTSSPIFDSFSEPQQAQDVGPGTHALARKVRRKRLAGRLATREPLDLRRSGRRLFGRQLVLGRARLKLVELKLQLVEKPLLALRAPAVHLAPELLDRQLQEGDLRLGAGHLRLGVRSPRLGVCRLGLGRRESRLQG